MARYQRNAAKLKVKSPFGSVRGSNIIFPSSFVIDCGVVNRWTLDAFAILRLERFHALSFAWETLDGFFVQIAVSGGTLGFGEEIASIERLLISYLIRRLNSIRSPTNFPSLIA